MQVEDPWDLHQGTVVIWSKRDRSSQADDQPVCSGWKYAEMNGTPHLAKDIDRTTKVTWWGARRAARHTYADIGGSIFWEMRGRRSKRYNPTMHSPRESFWPGLLLLYALILVLAGTLWNVLLHAQIPWLPLLLTTVNAGLGWWTWERGQRKAMQFSVGLALLGLFLLWLGPAFSWGPLVLHR